MRSWELIILIGVKLLFSGLGLSTHFRARVKRCLGLNTHLQRLAFSWCFLYYCFRFLWCFFQWFFNGCMARILYVRYKLTSITSTQQNTPVLEVDYDFVLSRVMCIFLWIKVKCKLGGCYKIFLLHCTTLAIVISSAYLCSPNAIVWRNQSPLSRYFVISSWLQQ